MVRSAVRVVQVWDRVRVGRVGTRSTYRWSRLRVLGSRAGKCRTSLILAGASRGLQPRPRVARSQVTVAVVKIQLNLRWAKWSLVRVRVRLKQLTVRFELPSVVYRWVTRTNVLVCCDGDLTRVRGLVIRAILRVGVTVRVSRVQRLLCTQLPRVETIRSI